jgi:hypothetical protein
MTNQEATDMALQLLSTYADRGFEISMPDAESYELMRATFARLGRPTKPNGELNLIKVLPTVEFVKEMRDTFQPAILNSLGRPLIARPPRDDNSKGMTYVKSLRDAVKRRYAFEYLSWIRLGRLGGPPHRGAMSLTEWRSVCVNLDAIA